MSSKGDEPLEGNEKEGKNRGRAQVELVIGQRCRSAESVGPSRLDTNTGCTDLGSGYRCAPTLEILPAEHAPNRSSSSVSTDPQNRNNYFLKEVYIQVLNWYQSLKIVILIKKILFCSHDARTISMHIRCSQPELKESRVSTGYEITNRKIGGPRCVQSKKNAIKLYLIFQEH